MAESVIDTLASLHVRFWNAPLQRMYGNWLWNSYDFQATLNITIGAEARTLSGFERGRSVIPARLYARRAVDALALFPGSKAKAALTEAVAFAVARAY